MKSQLGQDPTVNARDEGDLGAKIRVTYVSQGRTGQTTTQRTVFCVKADVGSKIVFKVAENPWRSGFQIPFSGTWAHFGYTTVKASTLQITVPFSNTRVVAYFGL